MDVSVALGVFIQRPGLALLPGAALMIAFLYTRRISVLITALSWLAYVPYEYAMQLRILCSGDCDIRVDLLLLYPLLFCLSLYSIVVIVMYAWRKATSE